MINLKQECIPHNKGKTKENYEPLRRASEGIKKSHKNRIYYKKYNLSAREVEEVYKKFRSAIKTAEHFSCGITTIYRILKENNVKMNPLHDQPGRAEKIKAKIKERGGMFGKNNPFYGKHHIKENIELLRKSSSRTYIEKYGKERAEEMGRDSSKRFSGKNNPMWEKNYQSYGIVKRAKEIKNKTWEEIYGKEKATEVK